MRDSIARPSNLFLSLFAALCMLLCAAADAKTTKDPNHQGWTGKGKSERAVTWQRLETKCEPCKKMVTQYNDTVELLLSTRYEFQLLTSGHQAVRRQLRDTFMSSAGTDRSRQLTIVDMLETLDKTYEKRKKTLADTIQMLEEQAAYLQWAIRQCEQRCSKKDRTKMKELHVAGEKAKGNYQPDLPSLFQQYGASWKAPVLTDCPPCRSIVVTINAVPGWLTRAHMALGRDQARLAAANLAAEYERHSSSQSEPALDDLKTSVATRKAEVQALIRLYKNKLAELAACEKKYCPASKEKKVGYLADDAEPATAIALAGPLDTCPALPAHEPITVGANNEVGSSADFKNKLKKKAVGAVGNLVGGLLGSSGGSRGKSQGPTTYKDPIKKKKKLKLIDKSADRELHVGAVFAEDGLIVSANIDEAPGKGTFQTIYLENVRGWRIAPIGFYLYEIWRNWKLTVSWTRDTYIDGEHVKHEEGGWSESWKELLARGEETIYGPVFDDTPIWEQMGFTTAVSGVRSLGTLFPVTPGMLGEEPINLVIHVTDPRQDPVITYPYVLQLFLDGGQVGVRELAESTAMANDACTNPPQPGPAETLTADDAYGDDGDVIEGINDGLEYMNIGDQPSAAAEAPDDDPEETVEPTEPAAATATTPDKFNLFESMQVQFDRQLQMLAILAEVVGPATGVETKVADTYAQVAKAFIAGLSDGERMRLTEYAAQWLGSLTRDERAAFIRFIRMRGTASVAASPKRPLLSTELKRKFYRIRTKEYAASTILNNSDKVAMEAEAKRLKEIRERLAKESAEDSAERIAELDDRITDLERRANNIQKTHDFLADQADDMLAELTPEERESYERFRKATAEQYRDKWLTSLRPPSGLEEWPTDAEPLTDGSNQSPGSSDEDLPRVDARVGSVHDLLQKKLQEGYGNSSAGAPTVPSTPGGPASAPTPEPSTPDKAGAKPGDATTDSAQKPGQTAGQKSGDANSAMDAGSGDDAAGTSKPDETGTGNPVGRAAETPAGGATFNSLESEVDAMLARERQAASDKEDKETAFCGPDVTAGFLEALDLLARRVDALDDSNKGYIDGTLFLYDNGHTVDYLPNRFDWLGSAGNCPSGLCASSDACFQLFDGCVPTHVLSDTMFGFLAGLVDADFDVTKAGGAFAEFNEMTKEQRQQHPDASGVHGALNSFLEDFINDAVGAETRVYKSDMSEKEASVEAYRFGHRLAKAISGGNIDIRSFEPSDLTEHSLTEFAPARYANAFAEMLEMGTYTTWAMLQDCADCPDRTPLRTFEFIDGMFVTRNNFAVKPWIVDTEDGKKYQIVNEAFRLYDPSETPYNDALRNLEITIQDGRPGLSSWEQYYESKGLKRGVK